MSNFSAEIFIYKYFKHWFNTVLIQSTLISQEVFRDYQVNLENTANLSSSHWRGDIQGFWEGGRTLYGGT